MSRILKLYDSESLASDSSDSTSSEVDSINSWIVHQKFDFLALKLAQNYVLLMWLVELIKMKLFPVFLLYIVSICPRPSYLLETCHYRVSIDLTRSSYDIVVAIRQGVKAIEVKVEEVEEVVESGEGGSKEGLGSPSA